MLSSVHLQTKCYIACWPAGRNFRDSWLAILPFKSKSTITPHSQTEYCPNPCLENYFKATKSLNYVQGIKCLEFCSALVVHWSVNPPIFPRMQLYFTLLSHHAPIYIFSHKSPIFWTFLKKRHNHPFDIRLLHLPPVQQVAVCRPLAVTCVDMELFTKQHTLLNQGEEEKQSQEGWWERDGAPAKKAKSLSKYLTTCGRRLNCT